MWRGRDSCVVEVGKERKIVERIEDERKMCGIKFVWRGR